MREALGQRVQGPRRPAADALLERGVELEELERRLDAAAAGQGSAVAIEGPPGIGKTTLLWALGERARARGACVARASGSEFEQEFPFAMARVLLTGPLGRLEPDERRRVTSGAARLGAAAIDADAGGGARPRAG